MRIGQNAPRRIESDREASDTKFDASYAQTLDYVCKMGFVVFSGLIRGFSRLERGSVPRRGYTYLARGFNPGKRPKPRSALKRRQIDSSKNAGGKQGIGLLNVQDDDSVLVNDEIEIE